jgi:Ca-activated chloride channel homolog
MLLRSKLFTLTTGLLALALSACAADSDTIGKASPEFGPGSTGISQAGAQDFGLFRQILDAGQIPGPDTLDDLGFFAEHKLDYALPTCGNDVCMHGLLGVMGNMITGSSCTLVQIGMNSPIDVSSLQRPPLHLVLAVDTSGSMAGAAMDYVKEGLVAMIPALQPTDKVSLITYNTAAKVVLDYANAADAAVLDMAFKSIYAAGSTNLYDGLFQAFSLADQHFSCRMESRPPAFKIKQNSFLWRPLMPKKALA